MLLLRMLTYSVPRYTCNPRIYRVFLKYNVDVSMDYYSVLPHLALVVRAPKGRRTYIHFPLAARKMSALL